MTHTSPTTFAVWSVLSTALGAFLLGHLYRFDKFKCLKWSNAPYSGAFKRVMTYSYLITIPLIMIYSYGFTYIKYKEGFIDVGGTIMPKPYTFWGEKYRKAIFPLMMIFSFAWSFEMVTHLEELCFWYFLITAGPAQPDWFHSRYFRIWISGSIAALVYLPVVTIVYRDSPLSCEARMFTAGSIGDLILTLTFIPVLLRFPNFIRKVKAEGVDSAIIVRLRKFYELNVIRIIFRFLMQIPLFALGVDGLKPHTHELNESLFWTDLLSTVAALGCVFSSVCTLLIFFPRSYEAEYQAKEASHRRSIHSLSSRQSHETQPAYSQYDGDERDGSEPTSMGKLTTHSIAQKYSDGDQLEDDFVKHGRTERRMGTGLLRERFGSKLRERERRIARGTKKISVGLHDVLSRRLTRLSLSMPRRRHVDLEASNAISLSLGMQSLAHPRVERDTVTRRTTPSARSTVRQRSGSTAVMSEEEPGAGATLEREGTFLLTNSPVLRAHRILELEKEETNRAAGTSVEMLGAAYEAGVGAGAKPASEARYGIPMSGSPVEIEVVGLGLGTAQGSSMRHQLKERKEAKKEADVDTDKFALDAPPPSSAAPSYSQATGVVNTSPIQTSPTGQGHVQGPRPLKKSMSVSTTATATTTHRRALPPPPFHASSDPLGAAPAYYPPEESLIMPLQTEGQSKTREESGRIGAHTRSKDSHTYPDSDKISSMRTHPFASATAPLDRREQGTAGSSRPTNMHDTSDALPISIRSQFDVLQTVNQEVAHGPRLPYSRTTPAMELGAATGADVGVGRIPDSLPTGVGLGLTAANVARLNSATASRASQVNPLVRTFTSPIDFLDRIQENGGPGPSDTHANASRTQIGWAV